MPAAALRERLVDGLERTRLSVSDDQRERLVRYLEVLARWNRRMNLTAFDLDSPTAAAIERLILEPVAACALIGPDAREAVDIGSGGGSPAIPIAVCLPGLHMTMIEVRQRKASFLREAVRVLGIDAAVEARRLEDWLEATPAAGLDLVTARAIRLDAGAWEAVRARVSSRGLIVRLGLGHITDIEEPSFRVEVIATGQVLVWRSGSS